MCYDDVAPLYEARGYHPLPVDPKDKFPVYLKADGTYGKAAGWTTEKVPLRSQGRANIGIRTGTDIGVVGVDVDTDDPDIQTALPAIVRDSLVKKKGQRGYTSFLYGPGTKSRKFLIDGKTVVEILGVGRQTVIPPSVHPVTQKPYEWVGDGFELLDVEPERDLSHVPADFEKLIEEALRPFGYKDEAPKPELSTARSDDDQTPHRQLNDFARANLQRWVPELGLERWRRKNGRYLSYEAVATWRPSTQGRSTEQRAYNLSITSKSGITDFGDGRSYTPLDLVMAVRTLNLSDAFMWLDDKLGWSAGGPEIVIPGPWEGSDKNARPEAPEAEEPEAPPQENDGRPRAPKGVGTSLVLRRPASASTEVPGARDRTTRSYRRDRWWTVEHSQVVRAGRPDYGRPERREVHRRSGREGGRSVCRVGGLRQRGAALWGGHVSRSWPGRAAAGLHQGAPTVHLAERTEDKPGLHEVGQARRRSRQGDSEVARHRTGTGGV